MYPNGLGPARWGAFNRMLPFSDRFFYPALTHDYLYAKGGTEWDKEKADNQFLEDCLEASGNNIFAWVMSIIYYMMVVYLGSQYYNYDTQDSTNSTRNKQENTNSQGKTRG